MKYVLYMVVINLFLSFDKAALAADVEVVIQKFKFIPAEVTINKGDNIVWINKEKRQYHSVWFEQSGEAEPAYFFPDERYSRNFNQSGTFPYRCGPHPEMMGTVIVH